MKKTILLLTLALCLCCVLCPALADEDYTVDSRNRITKYTGPGGDVTVPAEIGGKPVTTVQRAVFMIFLRDNDRALDAEYILCPV